MDTVIQFLTLVALVTTAYLYFKISRTSERSTELQSKSTQIQALASVISSHIAHASHKDQIGGTGGLDERQVAKWIKQLNKMHEEVLPPEEPKP